MYRRLEAFKFDGVRMFGDVEISSITKHMVYQIYEHYAAISGFESANKIMTAWQAAFKYATLTNPEVVSNPFSRLSKRSPPPRRQRWTDHQLHAFITKAMQRELQAEGRHHRKLRQRLA